MPNWQHDDPASPDGLARYLREVMPAALLSRAPVHTEYDPLVLLSTTHALAAFAFSNGDAAKSYESLYSGFKKHYTERQGSWDSLDLAFVFCVHPDLPDLDRFCSRVETDVYFCRKFVVPLAAPLTRALARLPFLPLSPLQEGQSLRPPSAQTFLQRSGVAAVLAKYLVVPHGRSADGIVEDCVSGTFGEALRPTPVAATTVVQPVRVAEPIRLSSVTIKAFRAYRKPQTFRLGADVTVLYGPNGFGKTSFFDAIDFAITGDIGRIKTPNEAHFRKAAKHLDAKIEDSAVSVSFSSSDATRKITRRVGDRKHATLDGHQVDRKTALSELTGGSIAVTDRVENFVSLFRATHLFSQEHQELAADFRDDCELSEQIVSRLLAFEDYSNAGKKAGTVLDNLRRAVEQASREIRELQDALADERAELDRIGRTTPTVVASDAIDQSVQALVGDLHGAGIEADRGQSDLPAVRAWRAELANKISLGQGLVDRLSSLAQELASIPTTRKELSEVLIAVAASERAVADQEVRRATSEQELDSARQALSELRPKLARAKDLGEALTWAQSATAEYGSCLERERQLSTDIAERRAQLADQSRLESEATARLESVEQKSAQARLTISKAHAEAEAVNHLVDVSSAWIGNLERSRVLEEAERLAAESFTTRVAREREISAAIRAHESERGRLDRQLGDLDKKQTELRRLVAQLRTHVRGGICPLCGHEHDSEESLLRQIQQHVQADPARELRVALGDLDQRLVALSETLAEEQRALAVLADEREQRERDRADIALAIGAFENALTELGIELADATDITVSRLSERRDLVAEVMATRRLEVDDLSREAATLRATVETIAAAKASMAAELEDRRIALSTAQAAGKQLRDDPRATGLLDKSPQTLAEERDAVLRDVTSLTDECRSAEEKERGATSGVETLRQQAATLKTTLLNLRKRASDLQRIVTGSEARCKALGVPADATEASVLSLVAANLREQESLRELRTRAESLEATIDTATTAAVLASLRQSVQTKERLLRAATEKREQHLPWIDYFESVTGLIASQQNAAIEGFTREYGPRTSVIQKRLRSVYGFDEVEIQSHGPKIRVRVKRRGEDLRPTDFFSQSQQQTLLLGLFLTACLSQTWSALCPIFLDDPVTHFDDLNTYAFLDLMVGLLESDSDQRQFIISTCDEKFLQLARQKFRHLGERAQFYAFSAIGAEGPVVEPANGAMA